MDHRDDEHRGPDDALLDAALRRRFHFVPFLPDEPPIEGLLGRWLRKHRPKKPACQ